MSSNDHTLLTDTSIPDDGWLLVTFNPYHLLLPRRECLTLGQITGNPQAASKSCGVVAWQQVDYPVFALDNGMRLQLNGDPACPSAILLQAGRHRFGLACQKMQRLDTLPEPRHDVPVSMRGRRQPFERFILIDGRAAPITRAQAMAGLLQELGARFTPMSLSYQQGTA